MTRRCIVLLSLLTSCAHTRDTRVPAEPSEAPVVDVGYSEPQGEPDARRPEPKWEQPDAKSDSPCDPPSSCSTGIEACDAFIRRTLSCGDAMPNDLREGMAEYARFIRNAVRDADLKEVRDEMAVACKTALEALMDNPACSESP